MGLESFFLETLSKLCYPMRVGSDAPVHGMRLRTPRKRLVCTSLMPSAGLSSPSLLPGVFSFPTGLRSLAAHLYRWLGGEDTALLTPRSSRPGLLARDQGKSWLQGWYKGHGELNRCLLGLLGLPLVRVSGQSVVLATTPWGSYCLALSRRRDCNIVTSM
jgi:hypothetical protein